MIFHIAQLYPFGNNNLALETSLLAFLSVLSQHPTGTTQHVNMLLKISGAKPKHSLGWDMRDKFVTFA